MHRAAMLLPLALLLSAHSVQGANSVIALRAAAWAKIDPNTGELSTG
jgi:hypothetical protein